MKHYPKASDSMKRPAVVVGYICPGVTLLPTFGADISEGVVHLSHL